MPFSDPSARAHTPPSRAARIFTWLVILSGTAAVAHSVWTVATSPVDRHWLFFAALTVLGGAVTIKVPSLLALLSVSEMFAFTCVLLFGPAAGTLTLALDGAILSLRRKHRIDRMLFNAAELGLSIWAGSHLFFYLAEISPLYEQPVAIGGILLPLGAMTALYFVLNSGLVATAIGLQLRTPPLEVWQRHFAWLIPNYFAGASISLLLVVALRQAGLSAVALILPLLLLSYLTLRTSLGRVEDANRHVARVDRMYLSTVEALATAIDAKDDVTHDHICRVQKAAVALARALGVRQEDTLKAIEAAALLHDTGKIAIPEHILNKPGKLTREEFEVMKQHAHIGAEILSPVEFPFPVVPIVRHHHESWDGTGYPDGLAGTDIPIGARILSVVDCFDALTSDRPYRRRMTDEDAIAILRERSGKMYDPVVVETFLSLLGTIMPPKKASSGSAVSPARARLAATLPSAAPFQNLPAAPEHTETLLVLSSLSRALSSDGGMSDTLALVWMHLRRLVPAAMAGFYSVEADGSVTLQHACGAVSTGLQGLRISTGHGVSGWVAANRRVMINSDAILDLGDAAASSTPPLRSCLSVPLLVGDNLVGVMTLYADRAAAFDEEHGRLVQMVGPHVAQVFQAALARSTTSAVTAVPTDVDADVRIRPNPSDPHPDPRRRALRVVSRR